MRRADPNRLTPKRLREIIRHAQSMPPSAEKAMLGELLNHVGHTDRALKRETRDRESAEHELRSQHRPHQYELPLQ